MNQFCRQAVVSVLGLALLVALPVKALQAQNAPKPAVILSLSNVDKLLNDVGYLTRAAGAPEVGGLVTLMAGQYIEGLDTKRPAGMFVSMQGQQPSGMAFIPVADFDAVMTKINEAVGEPEDVGQGVMKLEMQRPVFFKEANGWIYIADSAASLDRVPENPDKILGPLPERYNIAVQINVQQVPEPLRQMAISEMRDGFERGLENSNADPDQRELQERIGRNGIENLVDFIEGADQVTFGWGVDGDDGATYIDLAVTALPNSKLASQFEGLDDTKTNYAGLKLPGAAAYLQFSAPISEDEIEQATTMIEVMREEVLKEIDEDDDLPNDETRKTAKEVVSQLMDVAEATIKSGKVDGGAAVLLDDQRIQFVAGGFVADGTVIEDSLKKLVEISKQVEEEVQLEDVNFNVGKHKGVDLHTMSVPIPEEEEEARSVLGDQFSIAVGTSDDSFYLALGHDPLNLLREVIDASAEAGATEIPPMTFRIALRPIMEFAAAMEDDPNIARIAEALKQVEGKDGISIRAASIPNGAAYRIQVQEGVLQAIGQAARARNNPNAR